MVHRFIQPAPQLRAFVKNYFLLHFQFDQRQPIPVKPFPVRPQQCLVFYLQGNITAINAETKAATVFPKIAINGPQLTCFDFHLTPEFLMFSIDFQPGALARFLRLPLTDEFIDNRLDAEAILNPHIDRLYERMVNASHYDHLVELVEQYLLQRIGIVPTRIHALDHVCQLIAQRPTDFTVTQLADKACLSLSQFERRFVQQVGISPKLFARINRYHQAFQLKDQNPSLDWLTIALWAGYTDYQHLVKDFRQFSGTTPNSLLLAQAQAPERLLGIG